MLKKLLFSSFVAASFVANAQVLVAENFQGFTEAGYPAAGTTGNNSTCGGTPLAGTLELKKTYGTNDVTFTLSNSAVTPTCAVKKANATAVKQCIDLVGNATGYGSIGFIEMGKSSEYTTVDPAGVSGSFTVSILPYIGFVKFKASWTGATRSGELYTSIDQGTTWVQVQSIIDSALKVDDIIYTGGVCGAVFTANIDLSGVMLKFTSSGNQRTRIHDLIIDATPTGIDNTSLFDNGASVSVVDNKLTVSSTKSGTVQIVNINGVTVAQGNVNGEASFNIAQSGMYIVRLSADNKISTKKVVVQ